MEIIKRFRGKLKENKGASSTIIIPITVIISVMFLALLTQYFHLYYTMHTIVNHLQETVTKTATSNYYNVYKGIREGNSSAHDYIFEEDIWMEVISTAEVIQSLRNNLDMGYDGNTLKYYSSDNTFIYGIENISATVENVDVGEDSADVKLTFHVKGVAIIPLHLMGTTIEVRKEIRIDSHFIPRY